MDNLSASGRVPGDSLSSGCGVFSTCQNGYLYLLFAADQFSSSSSVQPNKNHTITFNTAMTLNVATATPELPTNEVLSTLI